MSAQPKAPPYEVLVLRLDAPLMALGGVSVDHHRVVQDFPALSMVTGLFANALGWSHGDARRHQALQQSLIFGARRDRPGQRLRDFQTVDLSQPHLCEEAAWTTRAKLEGRGGANAMGTHVRHREYWAGALYTVVVALRRMAQEGAPVGLAELAAALDEPARPLFLGRKCCLPASPLRVGQLVARSMREALDFAPCPPGLRPGTRCEAVWEEEWEGERWPGAAEERGARLVSDMRDWENQIHSGQRWMVHGWVALPQMLTLGEGTHG